MKQFSKSISVLIFSVGILILASCGSSHPQPQLIGNWTMVDNWSEIPNDFAPMKEDPEYEEYHLMQKELLKDVVFFYGKEFKGTIDQNGDTANYSPYIIEEDSIIVDPQQREIIRMVDKDSLLIIRGYEYSLLIRKTS